MAHPPGMIASAAAYNCAPTFSSFPHASLLLPTGPPSMNWPLWLSLALGIAAALVSIRIGQDGVERYGRRVPVTEMITLGRQGDWRMLVGGVAGYLMAACLAAALYFAL